MADTMDVEDLISALPHAEQCIIRPLRRIILDADPRIKERLSYGVPYFFRHRRLFFLWPASKAPSSFITRNPGVRISFGFCSGHLLSNAQNILLSHGRKQVYSIDFSSPSQIHERLLCEIINEALLLDNSLKSNSLRYGNPA